MRLAIGLATAMLWATPALSQTPPDTFKAGYGDALYGFYLGEQIDSERVAVLLPESISGTVIYSVRASFRPPNTGPVDSETWTNSALFTWGLSEGTSEQPQVGTAYKAPVPLKIYPELRTGGWATVQTEWPVIPGSRYWLVGYWHKNAKFVRLSQNTRDTTCTIAIGYKQSGVESWQSWSSSGLEIEVSYGAPGQGTPSGIFDEPARDDNRDLSVVRAAVNGSELSVTVPSDLSPVRLQVVNILGQTVVSHTGMVDFGVLRVPWSASHPSGVYFCRIQSGRETYAVPFVSVK